MCPDSSGGQIGGQEGQARWEYRLDGGCGWGLTRAGLDGVRLEGGGSGAPSGTHSPIWYPLPLSGPLPPI